MKLKALSHYQNDRDTRFGDCILLYDTTSLIVYDCGHLEHKKYIESFLKCNPNIKQVKVVVSHNDSDHTNGICVLLKWLSDNDYSVELYSHQYDKHLNAILDAVDDKRRKIESVKQSLQEEFNNIKDIINTAEQLNITLVEALPNTIVGEALIVGQTIEEFIEDAAKAIDNRESDMVETGYEKETVMNAVSIQIKCEIDKVGSILLCGDASPAYLKNLNEYDLIQLPHHGQLDDAKAIFDELGGDAYEKNYLISDNTGSSSNTGGSEELVLFMKEENYSEAYNTKNGIVDSANMMVKNIQVIERGNYLGDLDCIKEHNTGRN